MKGGYQIIDLKNTKLTVGTQATIPGVWDAIEGNYRKPTLLSNLVVGDTEYTDSYVTFLYNAGKYNALLPFTIAGNSATLSVDDADHVIISANE